MRYESEILYDLMKRDGLLNPSQDNLPYESELKEKYVNEVEGAYPKLQDYRAEWLNYNKCEYIPADFPTESQTNQTSGTFQNVVPFAYDVATLKGQTLVNLNKMTCPVTSWGTNANLNNYYHDDLTLSMIKPSTKYLFKIYGLQNAHEIRLEGVTSLFKSQSNNFYFNTNGGVILTSTESVTTATRFTPHFRRDVVNNLTQEEMNNLKMVIMEYQDGMENWDIPYFEGMQSTVNPKLITVGKNLINAEEFLDYPSKFIASFDSTANTISLTSIAKNKEELGTYPHVNIKVVENGLDGKRVKLSFEIIERTSEEACVEFSYLANGKRNYLKKYESGQYSINLPTDASGIQVKVLAYNITKHLNAKVVVKNLMLTAYPDLNEYDKYREITASANVTLRGLEGAKDELNLKTGEITTNIKEYTITGNEGWTANTESDCQRFRFSLSDIIASEKVDDYKIYVVSEKLVGVKWKDSWTTQNTISLLNGSIYMHFPLETTMEQAKQLMVGSKIQYAIKTPLINKIDLTIIDEDNTECSLIPFEDVTTYETSSDTIPPLADLTVCVEATTQNLASFVNLEGIDHNE